MQDGRRGSEKGQGLTEYAVLVSLVAVACIAAMALFGGALRGRIASLVAAVAGEDSSKVDAGNKMAESMSKNLRDRMGNVTGMKVDTTKGKGEVIDSETIQ